MAFGSGSSFATDRWTRRKGSPSSLQALSVGSAKRLHQHSSSKPTAQVLGFSAATSISRSRLLFSFVQGVRGGYPPLGAHPANPQQARKRRPDRLSGDALFGEPVLVSRFGGHPQGPQARLVSELPRGAVEHPSELLSALFVEGVAGSPRARGLRFEGEKTPPVEVVDGVAHRLGGASEVRGDLRGALALRARQEHLRAVHGEGVFGAQPLFEALALLFGQRTYKDRCFHGRYRNPSTETYLEDALGASRQDAAGIGRDRSTQTTGRRCTPRCRVCPNSPRLRSKGRPRRPRFHPIEEELASCVVRIARNYSTRDARYSP